MLFSINESRHSYRNINSRKGKKMSEQVKKMKTNDEKKGKRRALTVSGYALLIVFLLIVLPYL